MTLRERISNALSDALFDTNYEVFGKYTDRIRSLSESYVIEHKEELLKEFFPRLDASERTAFEIVAENFTEVERNTRIGSDPTKLAFEWLIRAKAGNDGPVEILVRNPRFTRLYPDACYEMVSQHVTEAIESRFFDNGNKGFAGEISIIKDWLSSDEFKGTPKEKVALVEKIKKFIDQKIKDGTDYTTIYDNLWEIVHCGFLPREVKQEIIAYACSRDDIKIDRTHEDVFWRGKEHDTARIATAHEILREHPVDRIHPISEIQEKWFGGQFVHDWENPPKSKEMDRSAIAQYAFQFGGDESAPYKNIERSIRDFTKPPRWNERAETKLSLLERIITSPYFGSEKDERLWLKIIDRRFEANFSDIYIATEVIKNLGECLYAVEEQGGRRYEFDYSKVLDYILEHPEHAKEIASIERMKTGVEEKLVEAILSGKIKDYEIQDGKIDVFGVKIDGKDVFERIEAVGDKYFIDSDSETLLLEGLYGTRADLTFSIEEHIKTLDGDGLFRDAKNEKPTTTAMQLIYLANGVSFDAENASPNIKALASTLEFLSKNSSDLKFYLESFSSEKDRLSTAEFADSPTYERFLKLCDGIASEIEKLGSVKVAEYIKEHTPFEELKERLEPVIEKLEAENGRIETYDDDHQEDISNPDENPPERKPDDNEKDNQDDDIE